MLYVWFCLPLCRDLQCKDANISSLRQLFRIAKALHFYGAMLLQWDIRMDYSFTGPMGVNFIWAMRMLRS